MIVGVAACEPQWSVPADTATCNTSRRAVRESPVFVDGGTFSTPMVSITFDDGWSGQAMAADELDARGLVGTFYLTSGWLDRDERFLTSDQARDISTRHEIGVHSRTHPFLPRVKDDVTLHGEIDGARDDLESLVCNERMPSFALPSGTTDDRVDGMIEAAFESSRGVLRGYNLPNDDIYHLRSNAMNVTLEGWIGEYQDYVQASVDEAIRQHSWLIFHWHQIVAGEPQRHIQYPLEVLQEDFDIIQAAVGNRSLANVTVAEGVAIMQTSQRAQADAR